MTGRRYDDREVALILKGAAQREGLARVGDAADGRTLPELEQIAVEVGLDPALVRRAAAQLESRRGASLGDRWRGGPNVLLVERVVDGEPAGDVADALLAAIREAAGGAFGTTRTVGRTLTWHGQLDRAGTDVSVATANGRTTVRVRVALDAASQGSFATYFVAGGGGAAFVTFAALVNAIGAAAALASGAVAGVGYLAARRDFARIAARAEARAVALADAVATTLSSTRQR